MVYTVSVIPMVVDAPSTVASNVMETVSVPCLLPATAYSVKPFVFL